MSKNVANFILDTLLNIEHPELRKEINAIQDDYGKDDILGLATLEMESCLLHVEDAIYYLVNSGEITNEDTLKRGKEFLFHLDTGEAVNLILDPMRKGEET